MVIQLGNLSQCFYFQIFSKKTATKKHQQAQNNTNVFSYITFDEVYSTIFCEHLQLVTIVASASNHK